MSRIFALTCLPGWYFIASCKFFCFELINVRWFCDLLTHFCFNSTWKKLSKNYQLGKNLLLKKVRKFCCLCEKMQYFDVWFFNKHVLRIDVVLDLSKMTLCSFRLLTLVEKLQKILLFRKFITANCGPSYFVQMWLLWICICPKSVHKLVNSNKKQCVILGSWSNNNAVLTKLSQVL